LNKAAARNSSNEAAFTRSFMRQETSQHDSAPCHVERSETSLADGQSNAEKKILRFFAQNDRLPKS
jgi:hypothetical protein